MYKNARVKPECSAVCNVIVKIQTRTASAVIAANVQHFGAIRNRMYVVNDACVQLVHKVKSKVIAKYNSD